jgi:hypothetical protein
VTGLPSTATAVRFAPMDGDRSMKYLLFVWRPTGYVLEERDGEAPAPGEEVEVSGGQRQHVTKVGPSPLPGDPRPCAFLVG